MSDTLSMSGFGPNPDYELAWRAVERGLLTKEQVEAAVLEARKTPSSRLLDLLPLTPEQVRTLSQEAPSTRPRPLPPEVEEAAKVPEMKVGKYVVVGQLGAGGMGVVVKAYDTQLRRWAALKFMRGIADEKSREYFEREARVAAGLSHPNIASIYEVGEREGQPYIAMQYVEGENLSSARKKMGRGELIGTLRKVAEAVQYAHEKGVVHRDLKPANVMVDGEGRVYVMDFGLAKETAVEGKSLGGSSVMVGTPQYMAPEQARGERVDARADVWSLGATLYEILTDRPPFQGDNAMSVLKAVLENEPRPPRRIDPKIDVDVETIALKCLEKDRLRRYATARELADDLGRWLAREPIAARPISGLERLARKIRRNKALSGALGGVVVLAVAGAVVVGVQQRLGEQRQPNRQTAAFRQYIAAEVGRQAREFTPGFRDEDVNVEILRTDDLNGDGLLDFIVINRTPGFGGSGGCSTEVYLAEGIGRYRPVLEMLGSSAPRTRASKTGPFADFLAANYFIDGEPVFTVYGWTGQEYELSHYEFCNGILPEYCTEPVVIKHLDQDAARRLMILPDAALRTAPREDAPGIRPLGEADIALKMVDLIGVLDDGSWYLANVWKGQSAFVDRAHVRDRQ